jgi:hypothetical protein
MKSHIYIWCLSGFLLCGCQKREEPIPELEPVKTGSLEDFVRDPLDYEEVSDTINVGKLSFDNKIINFDTIKEGETINTVFTFRNVGKRDLKIRDVRSSCGCTIPSWPEDTLNPGDKGEIKVSFNSEGRPGKQDKPIVVRTTGYPRKMELRLKGYVISKPTN